ncbi:unnamed protein product [Euphydryas editha]|uniref:DUF5641 domain-containing protein n=1 Tax=Euphydryas editha TaxID=104508 RepID=A0AAU9THG8_EUPED|nr:unnamed protein product [Euphydryas editha]
MEDICKLQYDIYNNISKAQINLKKSSKTRLTEAFVESRLENLEKQWTAFDSNHSKIVTLVISERKIQEYFKEDLYEKTEELYLDYKAELKGILKKLRVIDGKAENSSVVREPSVKLPKISIPTFSGTYSEWTSFRDLFTSLIHNNRSLDDVQKLHYLKGHLTGEAEQLLRHVAITAQNYQLCWTQLEKRYNNKRYLANCILKRFMSQKNLLVESSSALKELLDTSNECLNALNNLGIDTQSWDIIVIYILSLKLDNESRKLWEAKICDLRDELPNFKNFKEFLEQRFRSLEFISTKPKQPNIVNIRNNNVKTLHVKNVQCPFCSDYHYLGNCKRFAKEDVDSRRSFVQSNNLCFNCLGANHSVYFCRQPTKCQICKRKHHSMLHPKGALKPVEETQKCNQALIQDSESEIVTSSSTEAKSSDIVNCFSNVKSQVLLATALLADPKFNIPNKIDLLLGAEVYSKVIVEGIVRGPSGYPVAQNTRLGWILSGQVSSGVMKRPQKEFNQIVSMHVHAQLSENDLLKKFWELESDESLTIAKRYLTEEEQKCEEIFVKTTKRDESGRYIVNLPFRSADPTCKYNNSKDIALRRYTTLERRLDKDHKLKQQYNEVLQEYLDLGHMEEVPKEKQDLKGAVYLPHHAVVRDQKDTTKRWQLTQKMTQDFWRRWSNEYLTQFLNRHKWSHQIPEPKVGDVVLVKEDNLPPAKWLYGIIVEKHPGLDKITRVVSLRCGGNIFKRPVSKLCILPITD